MATLPTAYDYQLLDASFVPVSEGRLLSSLRDADVVFIGEYHGNQASHLLEMQLLAKLHQNNQLNSRPTILSMEMFTRDQQAILDDYIAGTIGERYLIDEAPAWKNYQGSYRPLVEYAKQNAMPVIAANASGDIVRCIGRQGESYIEKLDSQEQLYIAEQPFGEIAGYDDKFFGLMGGTHGTPGKRMQQSYLAQITRDNTMAESILNALAQSPGGQVVHVNGSFHSEDHLGTVGALKRMRPDLTVKVITPVHLDELTGEGSAQENTRKDDFYYLLNRQPKEFVNDEYMKKVRAEMFAKSQEKAELCK